MDILVVGAGASGMLAALTATEDTQNRVILLERQQRVGRKLLATGNGRCNLTNTAALPRNYHGEDRGFTEAVLERFPPQAALDFFHALGLLTVEEYGGRVYPLSNSANSVVDVLRFALERSGVVLHTGCPVREIKRRGKTFRAITDDAVFDADKIIIACGGAAGAKLGGVTDGYRLLSALGHERTKLYPALVQLVTAPEYPRALKGVRADAAVRLFSRGKLLVSSEGELQFTDNGVSGPVIFDISRCASVTGGELSLSIDFLRGYSAAEITALLKTRKSQFPELPGQELFTGMLQNRLGRMLVKYAALSPLTPICDLSNAELARAVSASKSFELRVIGTEGFDSAQVTAGGVSTTGFDPDTLESRSVPGLFVCGELLDVDGDCGGFNLQWAWASGRAAGRLGK